MKMINEEFQNTLKERFTVVEETKRSIKIENNKGDVKDIVAKTYAISLEKTGAIPFFIYIEYTKILNDILNMLEPFSNKDTILYVRKWPELELHGKQSILRTRMGFSDPLVEKKLEVYLKEEGKPIKATWGSEKPKNLIDALRS